jgi:hypothetical protein
MSEYEVQDGGVGQARYIAIERATANALISTNCPRAGFNRHGTLHGAPQYYGAVEMLGGLLLVVSWVRELSWWAENNPELFAD